MFPDHTKADVPTAKILVLSCVTFFLGCMGLGCSQRKQVALTTFDVTTVTEAAMQVLDADPHVLESGLLLIQILVGAQGLAKPALQLPVLGGLVASVQLPFAHQQQPLADSVFNTALQQRVRLFQRQRGLMDDGVVGMQTLLVLNEALGIDLTADRALTRLGYTGASY